MISSARRSPGISADDSAAISDGASRSSNHIVPQRALVLENWGAFVVIPVDEHTSRLHVRLRGPGTPSLLGVVLGPANLLVFEPAHFIMERRMLLGIRDRAEGRLMRVGYSPPPA